MSVSERSGNMEYPLFVDKTGLQFFSKKTNERWFCNRSLSPVDDEKKNAKTEINLDNTSFHDIGVDTDYISDSDEAWQNNKVDSKVHVLGNVVVKPAEIGKPSSSLNKEKNMEPEENIRSETNISLKISRKNADVEKRNKYKKKKNMCYFCETDVQNFVRHMERNHMSEIEVQQIFASNVRSAERRQLLALLKKKGNYIKNYDVCVKPVKQASKPNQDYLPCSKCYGFYRSKFLYRHTKKCTGKSSRNVQSDAQNMLLKNQTKVDDHLKSEVFHRMRADKISLAAKCDSLICAFGARYLKIHREQHEVSVTSRKMRELSRLLLEMKKIDSTITNLFNALQPKNYDNIVEAVKKVSKYDAVEDSFVSPTYAMNITTSLKQCCDIAITMILKNETSLENAKTEANFTTMIHLLQANWRYDISNRAGNDLNIKKFNKVTIVPLASDLKLLKAHLILKAEESIRNLHSKNQEAYNILLETIYCRAVLLNRRRPGELQRMLWKTYNNMEAEKHSYEEFTEVISETEKILLKNLRRVVIRGKRGKGVPVLFSVDMQDHIKKLSEWREIFLENNKYLFGKVGTLKPIEGYKVLSKHASICGARNPEAITCTRLRKHLATLTQLFNLSNNDMEQLASYMGHTLGVHKSSYRLPDDIYQTAKVAKLLILMEEAGAGKHRGKTLDDVDLDEDLLADFKTYPEDEQPTTYYEENEEHELFDQPVKPIQNALPTTCKTKRRILTRWTEEQKQIVKEYFKNHIKLKKPPKRSECEDLKLLHSQLFKNKEWAKIKVLKFSSKICTRQRNKVRNLSIRFL